MDNDKKTKQTPQENLDEANKDVAEETLEEAQPAKKEKKKKRDKQQETIEALQTEVTELKEKLLRNQAELQNFKRRNEDARIKERKFANQELMKSLLPVIDNFDLAFDKEKENEQLKGALKGFEMIYNSLKQTLEAHGLKEVEALKEPFDPNYHQAVMTEAHEELDSNMVIEVYQKGYLYKDRLLRPAMVKVSE